jgi:hypothetical protein
MRLASHRRHPYLVSVSRRFSAMDKELHMESTNDVLRRSTHLFEHVRMNPIERQRAVEGMYQAMLLADLTLKACDYVRSALRPTTRAVKAGA